MQAKQLLSRVKALTTQLDAQHLVILVSLSLSLSMRQLEANLMLNTSSFWSERETLYMHVYNVYEYIDTQTDLPMYRE